MVTTKTIKKGYKQTELGVITEDWDVKQFVEVMDGFSSGQTPYRAIADYYRGDIPWITSGELNYNIITDTIEKITIEGVRAANLKLIPKGTFLFAITGLEAAGTRGRCAITGIEATTNQSCMALYPKKNILITPYLYHYYVRYGDELAFKYCQGTKQQSYTGGIAKKLPIIVPPTVEEQNAIATILSDTDTLIERLDKLIAKKKGIKQGTMQQLLTGKKRLPGYSGEWEMKKLGEIFKFLNTANNSRADLRESGEVEYIHYGDIHTRWKCFLDCSKNELPFIDKAKVDNVPFLENGDLVIADASEDYEGLASCVEIRNIGKRKIVAGLHTLLLRSDKNIVADGFKGYLRNYHGVKDTLIRLSTGISVFSISKTNLKMVEVSIPPTVEEQNAIATILSDMDAEIERLEQKLDKYTMLKQGMMQELLNGKTRLIKENKA